MMRRWSGGLALVLLAGVSPAAAQDGAPLGIRLRVADDLRVGHQAPEVVLPYATRNGPGPVDQPFDLRKELGRVVVLVFYPGDFTPGCTAEWQALRDRAGSLFGDQVVVAGISVDTIARHVQFAAEYELPFKLLSDPDLTVVRRYDAVDGTRARRMVVVIGRDGQVRYIDRAFAALDPESYAHLGQAVAEATGQ